jgi:hypothetical protein
MPFPGSENASAKHLLPTATITVRNWRLRSVARTETRNSAAIYSSLYWIAVQNSPINVEKTYNIHGLSNPANKNP